MSVTKLFGVLALVFVITVGALAGLALWTLERTAFWDDRMQLAQRSYRAHLSLESHFYQLVKQHIDTLFFADPNTGPAEADLRDLIRQDIESVRTIIAEEIELVGEEEFEELQALARLEERIMATVRRLPSLAGAEEGPSQRTELLAVVLDREVDGEIATLIDEALEEEQEELDETAGEAKVFRDRSRVALLVLSALAALAVATFVVAQMRLIRHPLNQMREVLSRLGRGSWTEPVAIGGGREFRELGVVLSRMAAQLAAREAEQKDEARRLEAMVEARTAEQTRLLDQVETSNEQRRRLLADISHELRTPLTIIQGEADVTLRGGEQPASVYQDALARIRDGARHTNRLVDDLLLISRQEAAQLRLDRREHDVRLVLREAVEAMAMDIALDLPELPQRAFVDRTRLRQALMAIFQNARRHGGAHARAIISRGQGGVQILVEDDGPGLSDADKAQAFNRFFRGSDASRDEREGDGLGLPIVRAIVEAHGGKVTLADAEEGGLRVEIDLPDRPQPKLVGEQRRADGGDASAMGGA
jgi:signal transduction histidine kinase